MATTVTSTGHRLTSILERLRGTIDGLVALAVGDANGFPIAFVGPAGEREAATAMATLLVSAAERTVSALRLHRVQHVLIQADDAAILVHPIDHRFVLLALLAVNADIERARAQLHACVDDIRIALEGE